METQNKRNEKITMDLPNMVLSTTYALNRSNSKRVAIGLEFNGDFFAPVIKLCSAGSPLKYVTLDEGSWELFLQTSAQMESYLQDHYKAGQEFYQPTMIQLPTHNISFGQSYGSRAIIINERCITSVGNNVVVQDATQEIQVKWALDSISQPENTKKKYNPAGIVMQLPTYMGLKQMVSCVVMLFDDLREKVKLVNSVYEIMVQYLVQQFQKEDAEKVKSCLRVSEFFQQYYNYIKNDVENYIKVNIDTRMVQSPSDFKTLEIIILELYTCYLPFIAKRIRNEMFPSLK